MSFVDNKSVPLKMFEERASSRAVVFSALDFLELCGNEVKSVRIQDLLRISAILGIHVIIEPIKVFRRRRNGLVVLSVDELCRDNDQIGSYQVQVGVLLVVGLCRNNEDAKRRRALVRFVFPLLHQMRWNHN